MLELTQAAARQLHNLLREQGLSPQEVYIRFTHSGVACGGRFGFRMETSPKEKDQVIEREGLRFLVDETDRLLFREAHIDYSPSLLRGGFHIRTRGGFFGNTST
jgi:Fe-S cluster assembly iron-binding protein IscA